MFNSLIHPLKRHGDNPNNLLSRYDFVSQPSHAEFTIYNGKSSFLHNLQQQLPHLALKHSIYNLNDPPSRC